MRPESSNELIYDTRTWDVISELDDKTDRQAILPLKLGQLQEGK